jgi:hypothetical protein
MYTLYIQAYRYQTVWTFILVAKRGSRQLFKMDSGDPQGTKRTHRYKNMSDPPDTAAYADALVAEKTLTMEHLADWADKWKRRPGRLRFFADLPPAPYFIYVLLRVGLNLRLKRESLQSVKAALGKALDPLVYK